MKSFKELINEISGKLAGEYLVKVNKEQQKKTGLVPDMYGKMEKKRQAGVTRAIERMRVKEDADLEEAHKLGDEVTIHKGPADVVGKTGRIGEIRNGAFKGAPKTYTIDHDKGSIQLKSTHFKSAK